MFSGFARCMCAFSLALYRQWVSRVTDMRSARNMRSYELGYSKILYLDSAFWNFIHFIHDDVSYWNVWQMSCFVDCASVHSLVNKIKELHSTLHTRQSATQNINCKVSQKHSCFSWWWVYSRPKYVEIDKYSKNKLCTELLSFTRCLTNTCIQHMEWKPTDVTILFVYCWISTCFGPTGPSSGEFVQLFTQPLVQCLKMGLWARNM